MAYLGALFEHRFPVDSGQMVETIRIGLGDADARIRRMALTAVTGRSLGLVLRKGRSASDE